MRLFNFLLLKRFVKDKLGISYLNTRITEVVVDKATNYKVRKLEEELNSLKKATALLIKNLNADSEVDLKNIISTLHIKEPILPVAAIDRKFIFVCGLHRSGTSLFTKIFQSHPNVGGFENTGVIQDEGQFLQTVYLPDSELGWPGSFGYSKDAHLMESDALVTDENRERLYSQWLNYLDNEKEYFIEKSPPNLLKTRFLQALFPNSYFVVIKRHPVAACMATRKWSNSSMLSLIKHWLRCHDIWNDDKKHIKNYLEIKYEDFMEQPETIMESACKFCGLTYDHSLMNTIKKYRITKNINDKYFSEWQSFWLQKLLAKVVFKERIEKQGYTIE